MTGRGSEHAFFADPVDAMKGTFDQPSTYRPRGFGCLEAKDGQRTVWLGSDYPTEFVQELRRVADEIEAQMRTEQ